MVPRAGAFAGSGAGLVFVAPAPLVGTRLTRWLDREAAPVTTDAGRLGRWLDRED